MAEATVERIKITLDEFKQLPESNHSLQKP